MNVAIIGCGYVGRAQAHYWRTHGRRVTVSTRKAENRLILQKVSDQVDLIKGDLSEFFQKMLVNQQAVLLSVASDNSMSYRETYLETAEALVTALQKLPLLKQVIYTSSTSVYADHHGAWVDETTPATPTSKNGLILLETERVLESLRQLGKQVCVLRLGEIYGPEREISQRLRLLNGQPLPGSGTHFANVIHLDEIVEAIHFALMQQLDGIYNLCNDIHPTRGQLYEELCERHGITPVTWAKEISNPHAGNKRVTNTRMKGVGFIFRNPPVN